jgi:hypothetical protein
MNILLKESQIESAFGKLMKKHENPTTNMWDLKDVGEFSRYIDNKKEVLQFFKDDIDALPEVNDWFALYDTEHVENVTFTNKDFSKEDFPLLYYSKDYFSTEIGYLGNKFEELYKKWFEKTFKLPVSRLVGW